MIWIETCKNKSWVDLTQIRYVFVENRADGRFFLMGEFKDGSDSAVLSDSFDTKELCADYARKLLNSWSLTRIDNIT